MYEEALTAQKRLDYFVQQLAWKKQKSDQEVFQEALCSGLVALCNQNQIVLELLKAYQRYMREMYRYLKEGAG